MTIESYTDLQAEVVSWLSNDKIQSKVATCIQLAEARIRNDLLIRRMERSVHGVFNGAVIFLPTDCEAIQRLMYYVGEAEYSVPYADPKSVERYTDTVGDPVAYTMVDQAVILYPTPDTARDYTLYYVPFIADLSFTNTSSWVLGRAPNVYLFAACLEGAGFLQHEALMGVFEGRYKQAMESLYQASERQRMPSNTPLVARPYRTTAQH